jgi:hypothetical protein
MAASTEPLPRLAASSIAEQLDVIIGTILTFQASRAFAQVAPTSTACAGRFLSDDAKPGSVGAAGSKGGMVADFATEETDDPLYADDRNFYKVEKDRRRHKAVTRKPLARYYHAAMLLRPGARRSPVSRTRRRPRSYAKLRKTGIERRNRGL